MLDLVITDAQILLPGGLTRATIGVSNSRIASITKLEPPAEKKITAHRKIILPGLIGIDVHLRSPGLTQKETIKTGTAAAAAGGVTTILDMPNTVPPTTTLKRLKKKRKSFQRESFVNYGFHFGATAKNLSEIKNASSLITSVKFFLSTHATTTLHCPFSLLPSFFKELQRLDLIATLHAPDHSHLISSLSSLFPRLQIHLCHLSRSVEQKYTSERVTAHVTPHHLFFSEPQTPFLKVSPPIGDEANRRKLLSVLPKIPIISSDHAPHLIEEKLSPNPPAGIPGLETMLSSLITNRIPLEMIARKCASNPARIFRIPQKGEIRCGYDADLTLINIKQEWTPNQRTLKTKCGWSPFKRLRGKVTTTLIKGEIIYDSGELYSAPTIDFLKNRRFNC